MFQMLLYVLFYLVVIFIIILLAKKNKHSTDFLLVIWCVLLSTISISKSWNWEVCVTFAQCVILYLYVKSTLAGSGFRWKYLVHFIPFFLAVLILIFLYPEFLFKYFTPLYVVMISYIVFYFGITIKLLIDYNKNKENYTLEYTPNLSWLYLLVACTIIGHFIKIIPAMISVLSKGKMNWIVINLIILILLKIIGIKAIRMDLTFLKKIKSSISNQKPYSTYNLKEEEVVVLEKKLLDLMEDKKMYLIPELGLKDLCDSLDVSSHNLSFLLNTKFNMTFYEFINYYRLEAVKKELISTSNKHLTIYAIANDCGFNSQSTFNRIFKQKVGLSPSQYREKYTYNMQEVE